MQPLLIGVLGLAGIYLRWGIGLTAARVFPGAFPAGTFVINISGSFLIGLVFVVGTERGAFSPELRTAIMVGFLGGFTTFSSFSLEVVRLLEAADWTGAALYALLSPALGFIAAAAGLHVARALM